MNTVTQWFPISQPPQHAGWYEVEKGGVRCMGLWSYRNRRWAFREFRMFNFDRHLFFGMVLGYVTQWRGSAVRLVFRGRVTK